MFRGSTDGARRQRIWVEHGDARIAVVRWGDAESSKPPALLVHGTGFVAEVWDEVAEALASSYTVYAFDRRGHGSSHKPATGHYQFIDFAQDLRAVVTTLGLSEILGVGHSAGATDLLLGAKLLPERFRRLFAMEPTVMDPSAHRGPGTVLSDERTSVLQRALRRRAEFDSAVAAFERFRAAPAFARWSEAALWMYVCHGFETLQDGRVRLRCSPEIEAAMLEPIFQTMEQIYSGDPRETRSAGCPRSTVRSASPPPKRLRRSTSRWRHGLSSSFPPPANAASRVSATALLKKHLRCCSTRLASSTPARGPEMTRTRRVRSQMRIAAMRTFRHEGAVSSLSGHRSIDSNRPIS